MKTHFNNKGFGLGLIFSEGFWILEVAYWVTTKINAAKWNLAKLDITQYWSVVSPLIHCGAVFGHLQGLRIFTALLLRSNHFPHIAVHVQSFKLFCSHPSLPQDKTWQVCMKLSAEVLKVMVPGGCRSQGCHGYIQHSLKVPLLCSGDLSTPIYWRHHNTNH